MRFILPVSFLVLLLALLLPLFLVDHPAPMREAAKEWDEPLVLDEPRPKLLPAELLDEGLILQVLIGDEVQEMSMAVFLQGVVAAEMPARFHPEALRAQAVAARTYTLHRMLVGPAARHSEAYVCGSYACCKAFHDTERLRERWGVGFYYYNAIIAEAIRSTDGIILFYEESPILAAFHAASYGYTEASGAIWGSVPYLQSVPSFEGAEVPRFTVTVEMTYAEFREIARREIPGVVLDMGNIPSWIGDLQYTDSGRLASLNIGGVRVTGAEFRRAFGLRSTMVRFDFRGEDFSITTGGHGHGVGMSQFGANAMAEMGKGFAEILHWYYTDVVLGSMSTLFAD
ncbi:MAG: stage II sporulation protein D [Oscillospiraceae bacterium]|nr:stage II sporulation protein D [Oscillospiraceae bacterium]